MVPRNKWPINPPAWYRDTMLGMKSSMVIQTKSLIIALVAVVLVGIAVFTFAYATTHRGTRNVARTVQKAAPQVPTPTRVKLLSLVNQVRAKYGAAPLVESALLDKSAQWKANDEVTYNYFGHIKPGTKGNDGLDYLNSLRPPCSLIGENLIQAGGSVATSEYFVKAWASDKEHLDNMINPRYKTTGFGIAGNKTNWRIVEHFCEP